MYSAIVGPSCDGKEKSSTTRTGDHWFHPHQGPTILKTALEQDEKEPPETPMKNVNLSGNGKKYYYNIRINFRLKQAKLNHLVWIPKLQEHLQTPNK